MNDEVLGHRFWERWSKLEGKSLVARFAQADMLVEVCGPPSENGVKDGSAALLAAVAERTGYHADTLRFWLMTGYRVQGVSRDTAVRLGISWKTLQLVANSDKHKRALPRLLAAAEKGKPWTVTETSKQLGHSTASRDKISDRPTAREIVASATVEEKARIVQQIAKESPEAIQDAASDLTTRVEFTKGTSAHHTEADTAREERERKSPGFQKTAEVEAEVALYNAKSNIEKAAKELARIDGAPSDEARVSISRVAHRVRDQLDALIVYLEEGSSFDEDKLAAFLED